MYHWVVIDSFSLMTCFLKNSMRHKTSFHLFEFFQITSSDSSGHHQIRLQRLLIMGNLENSPFWNLSQQQTHNTSQFLHLLTEPYCHFLRCLSQSLEKIFLRCRVVELNGFYSSKIVKISGNFVIGCLSWERSFLYKVPRKLVLILLQVNP